MLLVLQAQTKTENWCGVLQEVALPGTYGDPEAFLDAAVKFANEECWGTLSCSLMVCSSSPSQAKRQHHILELTCEFVMLHSQYIS